ncbi:unnamed protein product [Parnassius apollo]|uniref:(apollo) hypothetical protein n=1 Tax=Parnassius apollo TaxID=110799 RepID=A0A8S3W5E6_PARAO|nr:unnamed protein product [Parnassius apollo]
MPLMRIRSVEIIFEDDMSTCTDTGILDRSMELLLSDSSEDSTKCVDDLHAERDENDCSVTLNAEGDLSDDTSISSRDNIIGKENHKIETPQIHQIEADRTHIEHHSKKSMIVNDETTLSLIVSEIGDSGHYTEDPCSSQIETVPIITYDDALLSHSFDVVNIDEPSVHNTCDLSEVCSIIDKGKSMLLYEYIESNSDSSDNTAICDDENAEVKILTSLHNAVVSDEEDTVCDSYDLQYDSFVDMGKF